MSEKKKRNIIIGSLCGVLLLMTIGYATFNTLLNINGTTAITSEWNVLITNIESKDATPGANDEESQVVDDLTATFQATLTSPGDSITYDIKVENRGSVNAELARIKVVASDNDVISFDTSGISEGDKLEAGSEATLSVKVKYSDEVTSQPDNLEASLTVTLNYVQEGQTAEHPTYIVSYQKGEHIKNIGEQSKSCMFGLTCDIKLPEIETESTKYEGVWEDANSETEIGKPGDMHSVSHDETLLAFAKLVEFTSADLKKNVTASGDGLYADSYESGRYIYKGASPNNYITFNNETAGWRIVSFETDGTIKIIRTSSVTTMSYDAQKARSGGYCSYNWDGSSWSNGCNAWASGSYNNNGLSGYVSGDSSIKTYLNGSYYNTIRANKTAIQNHKFYYGPAVYNNTNLSTQISNEKNYSASSYIGLIQASDYIKANTNSSLCGNYSLLRTNYSRCYSTNYLTPTNEYWTITPYYSSTIETRYNGSGVITISKNGIDSSALAGSHTRAVNPAIYLKADTVLRGNGTKGDPYTIKNYTS